MIARASDRSELAPYVEAFRERLGAPELQDQARRAAATLGIHDDPVDRLRSVVPPVDDRLASSGGGDDAAPFLSRNPVQSLLQSTLDEKLRERGLADEPGERPGLLMRIIRTIEMLLHPTRYSPTDPRWVTDIAGAVLDRLARGNHPFNPAPAEHTISDDARLVVVGDWGTGIERAQEVAQFMAEEVSEALSAGREVHVIHLGDIYYSGLPDEVSGHVLASRMWPVSAEQARTGVTSWSLNGNHDMYGGGFGYFQTLLGDPRFSAQRSSDGRPTSFFRLSSSHWEFVGLDTSWDSDVLSEGQVGVLEDPQAAYVEKVARESSARLCLLSHHQLVSVYAERDIGSVLASKLGPVLNSGRVTAWIWGHEHRCMAFDATGGVKVPRCLGHGGVPVLMDQAPDDPIPPPGTWVQRESLERDGNRWARFGFAVLDLHPDRIDVRYRDEQGNVTRTEQIS